MTRHICIWGEEVGEFPFPSVWVRWPTICHGSYLSLGGVGVCARQTYISTASSTHTPQQSSTAVDTQTEEGIRIQSTNAKHTPTIVICSVTDICNTCPQILALNFPTGWRGQIIVNFQSWKYLKSEGKFGYCSLYSTVLYRIQGGGLTCSGLLA